MIPAPERIRSYETIQRKLRQVLPEEHPDLFLKRLQETAVEVTNTDGHSTGADD